MQDEQEIRRLMQTGMDSDESPAVAQSALSEVRRKVGQRDTLAFALVKVWAALARLLAPFFAAVSERQALAQHRQDRNRSGLTAQDSTVTKRKSND